MLGTVRFALLAAVTLLTACGGGGGGDGGFLPDRGPAPLEITTSNLPDVVAVPFATVLEASGGEGAYEWSLVSDGGTSFTLDTGGVLRADEAIPEGTYGLTFAVTDGNGRTAERSLTIAVAIQPLAISSTALPPAVDGTPYSSVLEAVGGAEPYTWTLVDGGGTGFSLTPAGVLSGDPPTRGTYGLTVTVTDDTGADVTRSLLLQVDGDEPQPLAISTTALPQANQGELYAAVLAATGGSGDYSWQLLNSGGSGLTLSDSGVLRGTAPDEGTYGLTFRVDDDESTVQRSLTLAVSADDSPLAVETTALPDGVVGTRYAAVVTATGGSGSYSWTLLSSGGSGLSLSSNGVLSGTPGLDGTFGVTVRVSDGEGESAVRSLTVRFAPDTTVEDPIPLAITTGSLPNAEAGGRYATVIAAEGGTGNYTWSLVRDGATGLTLDEDGVLTGTAPAPGNYGLTFSVNDGQATVSRSLTLSVIGDGPQALVITTESVPNAVAGTRYATVLNASGGTGDYTWSFASGDGGTGLTLSESGVLSGIAPAEGSYGFSVNVDDGEETVTRSLTLQVTGAQQAPLTVTTNSLPDAEVGVLYAATLTASGGIGNYSWTLIDDGGSGLALDPNGALRGTPSAAGNYALTVEVTDAVNASSRTLTLTVAGGETEPPVITTTALPSVVTGTSYAAVLEATGGNGDLVWTLVQDGGTGLSLSSDGVFSGTAPAVADYGLTVVVEDENGSADRRSFVLSVTGVGAQPLQINTASLPSTPAGALYAATLVASGGTGSYSWTLVEDGGSGLTLDANGVLRGTAPAQGTYGLTVQVSDGSATASASLTLTVTGSVIQPLVISTTGLPSAETGASYVAVLQASGGSGGNVWTLEQDGGSGLSLDPDGVLSGTAPAPGSYGLTVAVQDSAGNVAQRSYVLTVADAGVQPLQINTASLPSTQAGALYAATLVASGGTGSYSWTLVEDGGSGLTLDTNGVLRGTAPSEGSYGLTVRVSDGSSTATSSLTLSVVGSVEQPLEVATTSLPSAEAGALYAATLVASGGTGSYSWTLVEDGGSGLTLDANGVLRGTAPAQGTYGLTVQVSDGSATASASLTLTVTGSVIQPLVISTTGLPSAETGASYVAVLQASGGSGGNVWTLEQDGGSGLSLDSDGVLSGTAPAPGSYGLTVAVQDSEGNVAQRSYVLTVADAGVQPLQINTASLPSTQAGALYAATLVASGGTGSYSWTLVEDGGSGLTLDTNGVLRGTAPSEGSYGLTVRVSDGSSTATSSLTLSVVGSVEQPLEVATTSLPSAEAGALYAATLVASGGTGSYSWTLVEDGGSGLTLDTNGVLRGTAPAQGSYGLTVQVSDGSATASASLTLTVTGSVLDPLAITTASLPSVQTGASYAAVLEATGGDGDYTWNLIEDGGTGLNLDADGVFSGTAPAVGSYGLTVAVEDGEGSAAQRSYTLSVTGTGQQPLAIATQTLPSAQVGALYAAALTATGGSGSYSWDLLGGAVNGLDVDSNGVLSGTPAAAGTFGLTFEVDDGSDSATRSLTLTVTEVALPPLTISTTALPAVETGESYAAVLQATGGDGDYTWTLLQAGGTGLSLDTDGVFSGTAPAVGNYGLTVSVEDGAGNVTQRSYVLSVTGAGAQPLQITTTTLPDAVSGTLYAAVLEAAGGNASAYNWMILDAGGSGLSLSGNVLEGTAPAAGDYGITVQVMDGQASDVASFVLSVTATGDAPLQITTASLPAAATDSSYVTVLEAQGGTGTYSWTLVSNGGLGGQIGLDSDGILSGTITSEGSYGLTFLVDDGNTTAQRSLVLTVTAEGDEALAISTETLPDATSTIYAAVLQATGGVQPYTWMQVDLGGSSLNLSADGALSGETPAPGVYALTVSVMDADGTTVTKTLSLTVTGGPAPPVAIITDDLPDGNVGEFYATVIRATGGSGEYLWSLLGPSAPPAGLSIAPATGVLSWSEADVTAGTYTLTIEVSDVQTPISADTVELTLTVN